MKLLQINASYKPAYIYGGPTMSVSKLSEQMVQAGCNVKVYTTTANGNTELPVSKNVPTNIDGADVIYFKRITKDHSHFSPALLKRLWKDAKDYDLIHIHAWWNLVSVLSCFIALIKGVPVLVSPRGTLSSYSFGNKNILQKKLIHNLFGKYLLNRSYIHVTSPREKEGLIDIIAPKAFFDIPNFIEFPANAFPGKQERYDTLKLLFFSRIEEKKGLDILLNALVNVIAPYTLTIAGDGNPGYIATLKLLADHHQLSEKISWIGFQGDNKFELMQQHDLLVLPSYDENFGNVVIESLSMGTAVLISRFVGLADYVEENDIGWISEHNAVSFADAINLVGRQKTKLANIRNTAPARIRKDFDDEQLASGYIHMYKQIIDNS